jgi:hypothetical protein
VERFATVLADAGGAEAPATALGRLRTALAGELERGRTELTQTHSGYGGTPLAVAFGAAPGGLRAVLPLEPAFRVDASVVPDRAFLLAAATAGAFVTAGATGEIACGALGPWLVLGVAVAGAPDPELAALACTEALGGVDRLRAEGLAVPAELVQEDEELRPPVGATHPLRVAAAVAAAGGDPLHPAPDVEDAVLAVLGAGQPEISRPHDDPDPARRVARRILQRMAGMGKWGGYHTEFVHLARGFEGNDRRLAEEVGEALVASGLLGEKVSVGQRHVFLDPRRKADIHALMERGEVPAGLTLP